MTKLWDTTTNNNNKSSTTTAATNQQPRPQSVAVIGAGAVGCYYGARLWQAGHDVQFYARTTTTTTTPSLPTTTAKKVDLTIESIDGNFVLPDWPVVDDTRAMRPAPDWILVTLKSTALSQLPSLLRPLLQQQAKEGGARRHTTNILTLMKGLVDDDLVTLLQQELYGDEEGDTSSFLDCCRTLYGGLAFLAAHRTSPTHVQHVFAGPIAAGVVTSHVSDATARHELEQLWQPVPTVPCQWESNVRVGRYRKLLWNLPFNSISVLMGGLSMEEMTSDPSLLHLVKCAMEETLAIAVADCGTNDNDALSSDHVNRILAMAATMGDFLPSTTIDFLEGRPMEVEYLFTKPLERAQALGVATPHLWSLVQMVQALERQREQKQQEQDCQPDDYKSDNSKKNQ